MPDLLIELFSEEIPARMQKRAADDLKKLVTDGLVEAGLTYASAGAFSMPRRLALTVEGLLARSPDQREERKGPCVDAPEKAIEGFLRGAGVAREALEERDTPKGAVFTPSSTARGVRLRRSWRRCWKARSATSHGQNPCAGAPAACAGCVRCIRSSASSATRRARRLCRWTWTGSPPEM